MDTKVIESLVPITSRPYLREYLRMERVEIDKELLAFILPLIPYDERADLVFDSYLNVAGAEADVISRHVHDIANALQAIRDFAHKNPESFHKFQVGRALESISEALEAYGDVKDIPYEVTEVKQISEDDVIPIYDDAAMKAYLDYLEAIKLLK